MFVLCGLGFFCPLAEGGKCFSLEPTVYAQKSPALSGLLHNARQHFQAWLAVISKLNGGKKSNNFCSKAKALFVPFTRQGAGSLAGKGQRCHHLSARAELPIHWDLSYFQGFWCPKKCGGNGEGQCVRCVCQVGAAWRTDDDGSGTGV